MKLDDAIRKLEKKLNNEEFETEENRKECLEHLEWLEELRESRKVIKSIQKQLLNSNVSVLINGKMAADFD